MLDDAWLSNWLGWLFLVSKNIKMPLLAAILDPVEMHVDGP
jgi:hypothetical protein